MQRLTGQRQRRTWVRAAVACGLALLVVAVAGATAATTRPGLDRAYGKNGVVKIQPPIAESKYGDGYLDFEGFTAAADGDAFTFGSGFIGQKRREIILRFDRAGHRDTSYGGRGVLALPLEPNGYTAFADRKARLMIGTRLREQVLLRRFTLEGHADRSFGSDGVQAVPCDCRGGHPQLRLFEIGDGGILVDVNRTVSRGEQYEAGTSVRLIELLPDGRIDRRFGRAGSLSFEIPRPGSLRVVAPTPSGAILLGGPGRPNGIPIYLWRVTADGRVDQAFDRRARLSLRRMGALGRSPELGAIVPTAGEGVAALGSADGGRGFLVRLDADGEPDRTLAGRGAERLPFSVQSAIGGLRGAIFAVGRARNGYRYRAFRVLRDGKLDPSYLGAKGRAVPFSGARIHVLSQGSGRVLAVGRGLTYCRSGCGFHPAMARFRE
jgi:hypothetical protein